MASAFHQLISFLTRRANCGSGCSFHGVIDHFSFRPLSLQFFSRTFLGHFRARVLALISPISAAQEKRVAQRVATSHRPNFVFFTERKFRENLPQSDKKKSAGLPLNPSSKPRRSRNLVLFFLEKLTINSIGVMEMDGICVGEKFAFDRSSRSKTFSAKENACMFWCIVLSNWPAD